MKKSGLADSPFFVPLKGEVQVPSPLSDTPAPAEAPPAENPVASPTKATAIPRNHATTTPRGHDTTVSLYHDTVVEVVRRAVKEFGKEAATHRFTMTEKKAIADIIYTYKRQGIRTSENEIARIAINYLIDDFKENGEHSILQLVLTALNE